MCNSFLLLLNRFNIRLPLQEAFFFMNYFNFHKVEKNIEYVRYETSFIFIILYFSSGTQKMQDADYINVENTER